MSQSYVQFYLHIVFHTKNNEKLIIPEIELELYSYLGGILKNLKSNPIQIGGTADHIHILCTLPKTMAPADLVEEIKKSSSKWIKSKGPVYHSFYWQDGYGGFSISNSGVEPVRNYILTQKEHHRVISARDEYKNLLDTYDIQYEERYL
jgi:putative transposase